MPEKTPPDTPSGTASEAGRELPAGPRRGLPDWAWATILTAAILVTLIVIGHGTFVA